ncbi:MAG: hypothetical protein AVDCRST_MAG80-1192 [uncultured Rubrobacteraceae bacterium]|uniref:Uncharacterized protein n=1 Tax=uncultured Rubrobacteraceae bacterium TaxID=349277 RepID=A0A6J4QGX2_9ACTN|nr:MAG: hypothetical protein AVDCRST_MAG80-1192 [uncultured Rubrobacteraceae bacterium]
MARRSCERPTRSSDKPVVHENNLPVDVILNPKMLEET